MKVISERQVREEVKRDSPKCYEIPEHTILTPAARDYLTQCRIAIQEAAVKQSVPEKPASPVKQPVSEEQVSPAIQAEAAPAASFCYQDFETGSYYLEKPEHMTQLFGNQLVAKDDPRIRFRGDLDCLESRFVLSQAQLAQDEKNKRLVLDLEDILNGIRQMMRADVLNEAFTQEKLIGLTLPELREHSHYPMKYYQIQQMLLPSYTLGIPYALLNNLRAEVRRVEVSAAAAFHQGRTYERQDILQGLNRMSSAVHIVMCRHLAGYYKEK